MKHILNKKEESTQPYPCGRDSSVTSSGYKLPIFSHPPPNPTHSLANLIATLTAQSPTATPSSTLMLNPSSPNTPSQFPPPGQCVKMEIQTQSPTAATFHHQLCHHHGSLQSLTAPNLAATTISIFTCSRHSIEYEIKSSVRFAPDSLIKFTQKLSNLYLHLVVLVG